MPSETLRGLATLAREAVAPYAKAGKVRFYQSGEEVVPGMRSRPSPGHTPGHNGIEFTSNGQTMLIWGDLMHNHAQRGRIRYESGSSACQSRSGVVRRCRAKNLGCGRPFAVPGLRPRPCRKQRQLYLGAGGIYPDRNRRQSAIN